MESGECAGFARGSVVDGEGVRRLLFVNAKVDGAHGDTGEGMRRLIMAERSLSHYEGWLLGMEMCRLKSLARSCGRRRCYELLLLWKGLAPLLLAY